MAPPGSLVHPYMPNSEAATKQEMLDAVGVATIDDLYEQIPSDHWLQQPLELPRQLASELELQRHLSGILAKTESCSDNLSFLGGGCWPHHVPAICDEIASRSEFFSDVWAGTAPSDMGRNQALFEFCSQIAELIDMDCVSLPTYSWACATGNAVRMAARLTGRSRVIVPGTIDPERLSVIRNYCEPEETRGHIEVTTLAWDPQTGRVDLDDLAAKLSTDVAAVYFESPSYLGLVESDGAEIGRLVHDAGAELIVGVDPISLGLLAAPADYGADIVTGTIQPLGVHMNCGGSAGGFIATRDEERYVREYPTHLLSICDTVEEGEHGFAVALFEQSSYARREHANDWMGTFVHLWAVRSSVYMALMGPGGFSEIGDLIIARSHYGAARIGELDGVRLPFPSGFFKEFVVNFDGTGKTVREVNRALRDRDIFGGKDLSAEFPALGQSALYCVTEVHSQGDIDRLVDALSEVVAR
jgi:glycine dehydrogenase subunit 1